MREFSKISPAVWQSQRFNSLPSDDGRYLYLYLLTNEHQNSAGAYRLRDGTACDDLQWDRERYIAARQQLIDADMVRFDPEAFVIMVTRWFKHNPPMNADHLTGIIRTLERLPSETIVNDATEAVTEAWDAIQEKRQQESERKQKAAPGALGSSKGHGPDLLNTRFMSGSR